MGLFGDDEEQATEEVDPPELDEAEVDEPQASDDASPEGDEPSDASQPEDEEDGSSQEADASSGASEEADQQPEEDESSGDIDVEEALKDLSARMSMLSSNLEGVQESRGELEEKIDDVEDRMSRLGSLAEAVSSEYNPFISENAPAEPSWNPESGEPEPGEAVPGSGPSSGPDDPTEDDPDRRAPRAAEATAENAASDTQNAPEQGTDPTPGSGRTHQGEASAHPAAPRALEAAEAARAAADSAGNDGLEASKASAGLGKNNGPVSEDFQVLDALASGPRDGRRDRSDGSGSQRERPDELEENLLMLEWVGTMLDRVGRAGLMDLLDYYQNLGWLDRELKERATRIAVGVEAPDRVGDGHWRGDVDLHRQSLVAIQRLQGEQVSAARLDELDLDLQRLFEE